MTKIRIKANNNTTMYDLAKISGTQSFGSEVFKNLPIYAE